MQQNKTISTVESSPRNIDDLVERYGEDFPEDPLKMGEYYDKIDPKIYD